MRKLKVTEMGRMNIEEFKASEKIPLIVVLDDVRSMYNVGSIFRTSDAFRVESIYLCGITSCPPHQEIHKTALGAEDSVAWRYFECAEAAMKSLQREGYVVFAVEQCEGSTPLQQVNIDTHRRYAIIFGNEVKGVKQTVVDQCDGCIEIPQYGTKHSLNVASTAGIVIWEFAKQMIV